MLNFAQLSATLNLRAVMEKTRGAVDEALLGRLQNSASDRNWDSIEALWRMKNEVRDDAELRAAFAPEDVEADRRRAARRASAAAASSPSGSSPTSASSAGTPSGATSSSSRRSASRWSRSSSSSAATSTTDYDFPSAIEAMRLDIEAASREILDGLTGDALEEMRAANAVNLRMAPLTPDHHFYIDQGANAHLRLVLLEVGRKLVEAGRLDQPDDVMFLRYNELRALIGSADAIDARAIVATRRPSARRPRASTRATGSARSRRRSSPSRTSSTGATRIASTRRSPTTSGMITGLGASPGVVEGIARVVRTVDEFDDVRDGDILVCQMTNPAWVVLFTKIAGLVTDTGGTTSHPAVLAREFGIPAVIGTSVATQRIATGDRVRVDGGAGRVEILRGEPADAAGTPAAAIGR